MEKRTQTFDVYTIVTQRIITQLEAGVIPWRKPWTDGGYPQNFVTKIPYRGMNVWMLASLGYAQNDFLTFRQIKLGGGLIKKGEKGHLVVFWKRPEAVQTDDQANPPKAILRYYFVYNIAQCDRFPEELPIPYDDEKPNPQAGSCEEIIEMMPQCPTIKHGKQAAFYDPVKDYINMPKQASFKNSDSYYDTLFHELVHATGHCTRLNRKEVTDPTKYGSEPYSIEELTAEIGACYLNSISGIAESVFENNVAYINGWLTKLKNDHRLIIYASVQAQRAIDFILKRKPYEQAENAIDEAAIEQV